jgi:hypothetical protein
MNHRLTWTIASLLSVLLFTVHVADDIVRGIEKGGLWNFSIVPEFGIWLFAAVVLAGRRSGYIITLLGSILALLVPYSHMRGKGLGTAGSIAHSDGSFFFILTVLLLGISAFFTLMLSIDGLWSLRKGSQAR